MIPAGFFDKYCNSLGLGTRPVFGNGHPKVGTPCNYESLAELLAGSAGLLIILAELLAGSAELLVILAELLASSAELLAVL